jgi:hypothetical protein
MKLKSHHVLNFYSVSGLVTLMIKEDLEIQLFFAISWSSFGVCICVFSDTFSHYQENMALVGRMEVLKNKLEATKLKCRSKIDR